MLLHHPLSSIPHPGGVLCHLRLQATAYPPTRPSPLFSASFVLRAQRRCRGGTRGDLASREGRCYICHPTMLSCAAHRKASSVQRNEPFDGYLSRSQFFEYHNRTDEALCPTLLSQLDQHAEVIGGKIGLVADSTDPYRYYKFRDDADFAAQSGGCPPENGACALGDAVYSTRYFHAHEQAHDYAFRAWNGWSIGLLDEGVAVALSCEPFYALQPSQRPVDVLGFHDWRDLLNLYGDSSAGYAMAGFFVSHLAAVYGWQSVGRLHRRVPLGTGADDFEEEFARVYPVSMDTAWSEALGLAGAQACQKDWRCIATPMTVGETATPACDGEMHRSIEVGDKPAIVASLEGEETQLTLLDCALAAPPSYVLEGGHGGLRSTHWANLPRGTYAFFPGPLPARVALRSYLQQNFFADSCDRAAMVALDADAETHIDMLEGRVTGWIPLSGGGRTYEVFSHHFIWKDLSAATAISICDDCSATAACVPLPYGQTTTIVIGDHAGVRLQEAIVLPPADSMWGQLVFLPERASDAGP